MNREVPYNKNSYCDMCHKQGAYDFMGDFVCDDCLKIYQDLNKDD